MSLIDISGPIYEDMFTYGDPFPSFKLVEIKKPVWVEGFDPKTQAFEGFCMLTGTYIDGPAHAYGIEKTYAMHEVPLEKIFSVDAYVLKFNLEKLNKEKNRPYITAENIKEAEKVKGKVKIPDGSIILFGTGWGAYWDKPNFLKDAWFFRKDALEYLINKKPFIIGGDTPYFDNIDNEQGNWNLIYGNGILVLAPLVNLEKISKFKVRLYISPLNILNTTGLPVRAIAEEE